VSSDPQRWIWSLERLYSAIRYELWPERVSTLARAKVDRETIARLVAELEDEYREFDKRYRDTRRTLPSEAELKWLPPEERTARLQVMEADIDRQPYWGPYLETRWRRQLDQLRGDLVKLSKN
jgi:hypothetical protein